MTPSTDDKPVPPPADDKPVPMPASADAALPTDAASAQPPANDKPFRYNDTKWRHIKVSLAHIKVDADAAMVQRGKEQSPLRAELERLAEKYLNDLDRAARVGRIPTALEFVGVVEAQRAEITAVRDMFRPHVFGVAYLFGETRSAQIYDMLAAAETDARVGAERVLHGSEQETLRYEGKRDNAGKPELDDYLQRLAEVWDRLSGASSKPMYRNRFVHACAAPVVDKLTVKDVRYFLKKASRS